MKKFALLILAAALFTACSEDAVVEDQNQLDLMPLEADLSKMMPDPSFDNDVRGTYTGSISTHGVAFHGKLFLNIANNGNYGATVITAYDNEKINFEMIDRNGDVFTFANERGSFNVDLSDFNKPRVNEITIDGISGDSHIKKDRNGSRFGIILGTYTTNDLITVVGAWDFFLDLTVGPFIDSVVFTLPGGGLKLEEAAMGDFELGNTGCYGPDLPPFYLTDSATPAPTDTNIELYLVGQSVPFPNNGSTVIYDFGFSKNICDANGLSYDRMLCYPESTVDIFFAPGAIPVGQCTNITVGGPPVNGLYAWVNDADGALIDFGTILIDTSSLVPVPPTGALDSGLPSAVAEIQN